MEHEQTIDDVTAANQLVEEVHIEDAHASSGGLPQLDASSFPSQLFWLTVTFLALYFLMSRSVLPRVHEVLEKRRHTIDHDLDQANGMTKEAAVAKQEYETSHAEAVAKSSDLVADAYKDIKENQDQANKKLDLEIAAKLKKADKSIEKSVAKAKESLMPVVKDLATEVVKKISSKSATAANIKLSIAQAGDIS